MASHPNWEHPLLHPSDKPHMDGLCRVMDHGRHQERPDCVEWAPIGTIGSMIAFSWWPKDGALVAS